MGDLAKRSETAITVGNWFQTKKGDIEKIMPRGANAERFMRVLVNAINMTPSLAACSPTSIFLSTVKGFSLGLEVNGPLGEAYLVPFRNKDKGCMEAQFIPGYKGLIRLARQSNEISVIYADSIRHKDKYLISRGTDPKLEHNITIGDRGEIILYYAVAIFKDGTKDFEPMTPDDIEAIHQRSKAKDSGPWTTDYDEMAKKTVIKRLLKRLPMSSENYAALSQAIELDNKAAMGETNISSDIIDISGLEIPKKPSKFEQPSAIPAKQDDLGPQQENPRQESASKPAIPPQSQPQAAQTDPEPSQKPATTPETPKTSEKDALIAKIAQGFFGLDEWNAFMREKHGLPLTMSLEAHPRYRTQALKDFAALEKELADWKEGQRK